MARNWRVRWTTGNAIASRAMLSIILSSLILVSKSFSFITSCYDGQVWSGNVVPFCNQHIFPCRFLFFLHCDPDYCTRNYMSFIPGYIGELIMEKCPWLYVRVFAGFLQDWFSCCWVGSSSWVGMVSTPLSILWSSFSTKTGSHFILICFIYACIHLQFQKIFTSSILFFVSRRH